MHQAEPGCIKSSLFDDLIGVAEKRGGHGGLPPTQLSSLQPMCSSRKTLVSIQASEQRGGLLNPQT
jgi:hypothetical protein